MRKTLGIALAMAVGVGLYALAAGVPTALSHGPGGAFRWGPGWRGGFGMMGPGMMGPGWRGYGPRFGAALTPEQQTKLETIHTQAREKLAPLYARLGTLRLELRNLLTAPTVDGAAVKAKYAEIAKVREEIAEVRVETQTEVAKILTPQQRQQLGGAGFGPCPGFGRGPFRGSFSFGLHMGPHMGWGH